MRPRAVVHGTADGYTNHRCRCQSCRDAWALYYGMSLVARGRRLGPCTRDDCDEPQYSKGFCRVHYQRQLRGISMDAPIVTMPGKRKFDKIPSKHGVHRYRQGCRCAVCVEDTRELWRENKRQARAEGRAR